MSPSKARLTVTIDPHLVEAGNEAVSEGRVESLSAWVNLALAERAARDHRLRALAGAISSYETAYGVITAEELEAQERTDRIASRAARAGVTRALKARRRRVRA
jgi:Arc/MetJ-type ribon-helix-helix transcriptional regulator